MVAFAILNHLCLAGVTKIRKMRAGTRNLSFTSFASAQLHLVIKL